jgi:hypothetical protein
MDKTDAMLVGYYGKLSPEEIEAETGVPAMEVAKRTIEVLGKRDYLDESAQIRIAMLKLSTLTDEIMGRVADMRDRDVAPAVNSAAGAIGRQLRVLQDLQKRSDGHVLELQAAYGRQMVEIVEATYNRMLGRLGERFPDVDVEGLESEFQELLVSVAQEYDTGI